MATETGQAVIVAIGTKISTDATMLSVFDNPVDIYRVMAPQDPPMPYMVHRLGINSEALDAGFFHATHNYYLDLWDYSQKPTKIDAAVDRLKVLLHKWRITTGDNEVGGGIIHWFSGGYIQADGEYVWHYATQWDVRFTAIRDVDRIGD